MLRASVAAETIGIPSASIVATTFLQQGKAIARALVDRELPLIEYPGVIMTDTDETLREKVAERMVPRIVEAFTAGEGA